MGVQKSRVSRSRRGMRRSHDGVRHRSTLSVEQETGEVRRRHHVSPKGYYKGKRVVPLPSTTVVEDDENDNHD